MAMGTDEAFQAPSPLMKMLVQRMTAPLYMQSVNGSVDAVAEISSFI